MPHTQASLYIYTHATNTAHLYIYTHATHTGAPIYIYTCHEKMEKKNFSVSLLAPLQFPTGLQVSPYLVLSSHGRTYQSHKQMCRKQPLRVSHLHSSSCGFCFGFSNENQNMPKKPESFASERRNGVGWLRLVGSLNL